MGRQRSGGGWISWGLIVLLFLFFPPAAVILLLVKLFGRDRNDEIPQEPLLRPDQRVRVDTRIRRTRSGDVSAVPSARETVRNVTKAPAPKKSSARTLKIIGGILAAIGLFSIEGSLHLFWLDPSDIGHWLEDTLTTLAFLLGGGAMLFKGQSLSRDVARYARYLPIIGDREAMSVEELSRVSGVSTKQAAKDLQKMVENGYFGEGAYFNMELGYLFRSSQADREWQEKQREAQSRAPKEAEEGYSGILRNIRRANDEIADPVLSAKIDQLEDITARIFQAVEADPQKAGRIDTFLNYYLPTTQKLLDSYARFEAAGVEGENLTQAKERISSTMDMIIKGFSHQLDALYQADAMDVDSDIRVMESMFRRDTGSAAEDFGLGGSAFQRKPEDH